MMVHRHECVDCGATVDYLHRDGDLACGGCGGEMEAAGKVGAVGSVADDDVPADELRKLVEEWRNIADYDPGGDPLDDGAATMLRCADELEEAIVRD